MRKVYCITICALLTAFCLMAVAYAAPPKTISYQGYLKDGTGKPVTAATNLTFRLYSSTRAESGALWSESRGVNPTNGVYSVELGTGTPLDPLAFDRQYFLGVTVESGIELSPRQPLTSAPYAIWAFQADGVSSSATLATPNQIVSTVPSGIPPLQVDSNTMVPNLNADMVDGKHAGDFVLKAGDTMTGDLTVPSQITTGSLVLPVISGVIRQELNTLIHTHGNENFFAGVGAGNLVTDGFGSNTGVGFNALKAITTGGSNTASGYRALASNTTGGSNTASGSQALSSNSSGAANTASGIDALYYNTDGYYNTAIGSYALNKNSTGSDNTALGNSAGYNQTTGSNNIYIGSNVGGVAGESNVTRIGNGQTQAYIAGTVTAGGFNGSGAGLTGITAAQTGAVSRSGDTMTGGLGISSGNLVLSSGNLFLPSTTASAGIIHIGGARIIHRFGIDNFFAGQNAGNFIMSGSSNMASGSYALFSNTEGSNNTASGAYALYLNTTGSSNTAMGRNALSSNTSGGSNAAFGSYALYTNATGGSNTGVGTDALRLNSGGSWNTAIGEKALYKNTGNSNTATGYQALYNTTGDSNTGTGLYALYNNTTGKYNTAVGERALYSTTTNNGSTAVGYKALYSNTNTGNTATGYQSLSANTTGYSNTAIGNEALKTNIDGYANTATGFLALYNNNGYANTACGYGAISGNSAGSENTAVGVGALNNITTGSSNTAIGYDANVFWGDLSNATAIGNRAVVDASNKVVIGNPNVTSIGGYASWSNYSDRRVKTDIREIDHGLDFIRQLRPVQFSMKNGNGNTDFGFIAQDIEDLLGSTYNVLDVGGGEDRMLSLRYTQFIAPMVKAIQEQQSVIDRQQTVIEKQRVRIESLEERLARLEAALTQK